MKVVVIGAGAAGLSIGWRLADAGAETVVLERGQAGRAATWAAAGMLASIDHGAEPKADTELGRHSAALWPRFAVDLEERSGVAVYYRRDGMLSVASDEAQAEMLRHQAAAPLQFLDPGRAHLLEPLLPEENFGALRDPDAAQVDNRTLGPALAAALRACGGRLLVNEAAVAFEIAKDRVAAVRTPFGRHEADAFVLAAGAWSGDFGGVPAGILPPVRPMKGQMIALAPPEGVRLPVHLIWGDEIYLVPRHDRLMVGATVENVGFDTGLTDQAADWLLARATAIMPALSDWRVSDHWAGLRPGSPDGRPILGETALPGLFAATGQFRNGILFAPAMADILCALVLGRSPAAPGLLELGPYDPRRFAAPLAAGDSLG